jgi:ATP-dependent DNA helicase RecG
LIEEIKKNLSRSSNPLIADLFRRIQMVEGWGRGMPLIFENAPSVQFRQIAGLFIASFERPSFVEGMNQVMDDTKEGRVEEASKKP